MDIKLSWDEIQAWNIGATNTYPWLTWLELIKSIYKNTHLKAYVLHDLCILSPLGHSHQVGNLLTFPCWGLNLRLKYLNISIIYHKYSNLIILYRAEITNTNTLFCVLLMVHIIWFGWFICFVSVLHTEI